jgi:hypothetical protein
MKRILLVGILVIISIFLFVFASKRAVSSVVTLTSEGTVDIEKTRSAIEGAIRQNDGRAVWQELKEELTGKPIETSHGIAHLFGEELWKMEGLEGVGVCDESFGFGCYHSYFGLAIAEEGASVASSLEEACIAAHGEGGLGCTHGIGHGLGEYFGPEKLDEQLAACRTMKWGGAFFGCAGGVFMEYNFPATVTREETKLENRPASNDLFAPCFDVDIHFRRACMLELPAWWLSTGSDTASSGSLCSTLTDRTLRADCFRGIGYTVGPQFGYDILKTKEACSLMPDVGGRRLCRAGASWSFWANPEFRAQAAVVCEGPTAQDAKQCILESDLLGEKPL